VPFFVVTGLDEKAFLAIDTGMKRNHRQVLHMMGYKYDAYLGYTVSHILNWETDRSFYHNRAGISTGQIVAWVDANPKIMDSLMLVMGSKEGTRLQRGFKPGLLSALHWLFSKKNKGAGEYFINTLINGRIDLQLDDLILQLRELIIANAMSEAKLPAESIANYCVLAWNYWRKKTPVKKLRMIKDVANEIY
jgi:hypothetical protein